MGNPVAIVTAVLVIVLIRASKAYEGAGREVRDDCDRAGRKPGAPGGSCVKKCQAA